MCFQGVTGLLLLCLYLVGPGPGDAYVPTAGKRGKSLPRCIFACQPGTPHDPVDVLADAQKRDVLFMGLAIKQAHRAFRSAEIPVGAVLVSADGEVMAAGRNRVEALGDASAHAEMQCLQQAARLNGRSTGWRMLDCTLYVTLEPCVMCLGAIQSFRVKRVVYGAKNHLLGAVESYVHMLEHRHPFHTVDVTGGVRAEECARLMKAFFAARRHGRLGRDPQAVEAKMA